MYKLQCVECGGEIEISADGLTGKCKHCGNTWILKKPLDDNLKIRLQIAIDRQKKCEFSDAKRLFLEIANENNELSEAWWGAFLSEYGIEFVANRYGVKIPTCHRANIETVFQNKYYQKAIETAADEVNERYKKTAQEIEKVRKGIIDKTEDGVSYDVFICYKHTEIDDDSRRTIDYELGKNLYEELTKEGYSVFFSAETLNRIAENDFEPYIFKALSTARVMLLLCSDIREIESPWVKNEWGRFFESHNGKGLIPICGNRLEPFKPTQLPYELQKLNAIVYDENLFPTIKTKLESYFEERLHQKRKKEKDDLLLELEKKFDDKLVNKGVSTAPSLDNYFSRIETFINDKQYDKANEYCEIVLDLSPKNSKAYLYKAYCSLKVPSLDNPWKIEKKINSNVNFKHAKEFATSEELSFLQDIENKNNKYISDLKELKRKNEIYSKVQTAANDIIDAEKLRLSEIQDSITYINQIIFLCDQISGFKNTDDIKESLKDKIVALEKVKQEREEDNRKKKELARKQKAEEEKRLRRYYARERHLSHIRLAIKILSFILLIATIAVGYLLRSEFADKVSFYISAGLSLVLLICIFVNSDETVIVMLAEVSLFIGVVILDYYSGKCIEVFFGKLVWFIIAKWVFIIGENILLLLSCGDDMEFGSTPQKLFAGIGSIVLATLYIVACYFGITALFWVSLFSPILLIIVMPFFP